ncbi:hypothetical protein GOP47_0024042 [Adiantum capillus-veneris]|uniref:Uncharacterized protein n=1 Tax=Adiantum capillus-veneris TaxID=13818 RepID=A0A9D4Z5R8_ADICA|nr:hypothetical protein GOP47_0024042 [Adiantum capillus-veneris]
MQVDIQTEAPQANLQEQDVIMLEDDDDEHASQDSNVYRLFVGHRLSKAAAYIDYHEGRDNLEDLSC